MNPRNLTREAIQQLNDIEPLLFHLLKKKDGKE